MLTNLPRPAEPLSPLRRRLLASDRAAWIFLAAAGVVALFAVAAKANDIVLYNHSPSLPVGFYLRSDDPIARGVIVTVRAADIAADYARERSFVDDGDRFIKRVAATSGDTVCANGDAITLNGAVVAHRQVRDSAGRILPRWDGCRTLLANEFLLLGDTEDSFDSRYWGVVDGSQIEGVWRSILVNSDQSE